jgi:hypothetical protein
MAARRDDPDVVRQRIDELERRLSERLDLVLADTARGALDPGTRKP